LSIILGVAIVVRDNETVSGDLLTDYSYITDTTNGLVARCMTGLGPSGTDDNTALGIWNFNGAQLPYGLCEDPVVDLIQSRIANITNSIGVINLWQCGPFTTTAEGVYTCSITDSSMMNQTLRLGVYYNKRSEYNQIRKKMILLLYIYTHLSRHSCSNDRPSIIIYHYNCSWFSPYIVLYLTRFSPRHIHMEEE